MNKHLSDYTIEELGATSCQDCKVANMAEYACRDEIKGNTPICVDCCHCPEHDQCDPCAYWVETDLFNRLVQVHAHDLPRLEH